MYIHHLISKRSRVSLSITLPPFPDMYPEASNHRISPIVVSSSLLYGLFRSLTTSTSSSSTPNPTSRSTSSAVPPYSVTSTTKPSSSPPSLSPPVTVVRGMHDIMDEELQVRKHIEHIFYQIVSRRGYVPIETPIVESIHLYERGLGNDSDVIMKEMYTIQSTKRIVSNDNLPPPPSLHSSSNSFTTVNSLSSSSVDSSGTLALRPEGTAGVIRAIMNANKLRSTKSFPLRYAYYGPMFRHERPQKGRYRQFTQLGIESINSSNPQIDIESISQAYQFLRTVLPLSSSSSSSSAPYPLYRLKLLINTLGDNMESYVAELTKYFEIHRSQLSVDSQYRLSRGAVLRILDSKHPVDRTIVDRSPRLYDYLSNESKERFQIVLQGLDALAIPYEIDYRLVRGLEYYCHTVFEFIVIDDVQSSSSGGEEKLLQQQNQQQEERFSPNTKVQGTGQLGTVLAGGRYDKLSKLLGYCDSVPCIGWAAGMERLSILSSSYILSACTSSSLPKRYRLAILPVYNPHEKEQQSINNAVIKYCQELAHYCEQIRLVPSSSSSLSVVTKENNPPINSTLLELLTSSLSTSSFQSNRTLTTILCEPHGKLKSLLAQVSQQNIDIAIIIGSNEIQSGTIILKDLRTGKQMTTMNTLENVSSFIQRWWNDGARII